MRILPSLDPSASRRFGGRLVVTLRVLTAKCAADNVSPAAAAIAFFSLLTAFPGLGVILSCYGLVADPVTIERHLDLAAGLLPDDVVRLLSADLHGFLRFQRHHLGVSMMLTLFFTVTGGRAAVGSLIAALNTVYGKKDGRRALHKHGIGLVLIAAILAFVAITFALVALTPLLVYYVVPLSRDWRHAIDYLRWPLLAALTMAALTRLYRVAPHRERGRQSWLNWGSGIATALWLLFSVAYSYYLSQVGGYNVIYGSVSATVALLIWLYLSSLAVLIGAEIDALNREGKAWQAISPTPRTPSG
jgi:membrane protein